jgi:hypothetical protein
MAAYDTTSLVASVKRRGSVPTTQALMQSQDFLDVANEELLGYVVPVIMKARSDFFRVNVDQLIAGQTTFRMPARAIGGKLAEIKFIDLQGNRGDVPQISENDLQDAAFGAYVLGNTLSIWNSNQPLDARWYTLRLSYYQRPSTLVYPSSCGVVSSAIGGSITLTAPVPAGFSSGALYDIVRAAPGFECLATDVTANVSGSTVTLSTTAPADMRAGDYVCLAQQSPVPQIPAEFHGLLAQAITVKVLQAIGDTEQLGTAAQLLARAEDDATSLIAKRIDGTPRKIVNRGGLFRSAW